MIGLKLDDFDAESYTPDGRWAPRVWLRETKGQRSEWQHIATRAADQLREVRRRRHALPTNHQAFFLGKGWQPLGNQGFTRFWRELMFEAGLNPDEHRFHMCRHTFAGRLRRRGAMLSEISGALRHMHLSTTERYLARIDSDPKICDAILALG